MNQIGKLNARIYRNYQTLINTKLRDMTIQAGQHDFFYVISKNEGITQKELAKHLCIGKSTTAKAVKCLMEQGYIYRKKDTIDKRYERLFLTEKGKEIEPEVTRIFHELIHTAVKGMTKEEVACAEMLLNKILHNILGERDKNEL